MTQADQEFWRIIRRSYTPTALNAVTVWAELMFVFHERMWSR